LSLPVLRNPVVVTQSADDFDRETTQGPARVPRVSIGMPVYNGMRFMERAVRSISEQTYRDFELIIVDNASADGSFEYACGLTSDPRVRLSRNTCNIGAVKNFMKVLELARGEYFMWAPIDDVWAPQFVERMVIELDQHPAAAVAMSAAQRIAEDGTRKGTVRFLDRKSPQRMSPVRLACGIGSVRKYNYFINGLFRRSVLLKVAPYFLEGSAPERVMLTHLALHSEFRYVDETLYFRTEHRLKHEARYPDEPYARNVARGFIGDLELLNALSSSLCRSQVVPRRRKLYAPIVVARFAWTRFSYRFVGEVGRPISHFFERPARRFARRWQRFRARTNKWWNRQWRGFRRKIVRAVHLGLRH
jgi:glycosyltransferase involved in cell wall biosynthesis